jgi:hypothetical protein
MRNNKVQPQQLSVTPVEAVQVMPAAPTAPTAPAAPPAIVRNEKYRTALNEQPAGLLQNVSDLSETPDRAIKRILLPNEVILADFDCYYPFKMLPMWKIIFLCVVTGGLFAFVLLYRSIARWCYRSGCCTPKHLEYTRGKV